MNKKLIALAVAGALGTPMVALAQGSSVQIVGAVQAEYQSTKIDVDGASTNNYRQESISDNAGRSRWGMLISEDLGNGLKANAKIDFSFRTGNGVTETAREQWVGLSSKSWGEVQFGRVNSPLKDFVGGGTIDPFLATTLQARGTGGAMGAAGNGTSVGGFIDHAIRYNSPEFGGFSASVVYIPSDATQAEVLAQTGNTGGKGGANDFQIAGKYKFGTVGEVFGAYSKDNVSDTQVSGSTTLAAGNNFRTADDETTWRIGGKVTFGDFTLVGQYDNIENALAIGGAATCGGGASANGGSDGGITTSQCNSALNINGDGDIWFLGAQYKIGKTTLVLQGGKTNADEVRNQNTGALTSNEREAKNITLGAIYNFSKRTRVFGGYQRVSVDGAREVANTGTTTGTTVLTTQPDRSTWTIGMRHDF